MIPYGSLVVFVTPKGRRYIKRLEEGRDWHSNDGTLPAAQVAALDFGSETSTTLGVPIRVLEATLFDRLQGIKRQTQIIYAKDIAYICLRLGAGPGRTIIEAGCGSGGLTVGFSWFCGPTGKVVSHDARENSPAWPAAIWTGPGWAAMWSCTTRMWPKALQPAGQTRSFWTCAPPGNI